MSSTLETASQTEEEVSTQKRTPPVIKPAAVTIHAHGFCYKTAVAQAPEGLTIQDLNDHPEVWRLVQADRNGKALSEWDVVEVRLKDALVTARVNHAGQDKVVLFDIRRATKAAREVALFNDGTFEVRWCPEGGYAYWRIHDNVRMSHATWPTPEAAKNALLHTEYQPQQSGGVFG